MLGNLMFHTAKRSPTHFLVIMQQPSHYYGPQRATRCIDGMISIVSAKANQVHHKLKLQVFNNYSST